MLLERAATARINNLRDDGVLVRSKSLSIASKHANDRISSLDLSQLVPQIRAEALEPRLTLRG